MSDNLKNLETLNKIAPVILLADISAAGGIWYFREEILPDDMLWVAAPVAIALMFGALAAYFVLQSIGNKANRK
ncbi:MAG: hypothetical protein LRZ85_06375 [Alphaproteobacteria bacterium]|nr:hypothetical protein [Alphaproteobacteria bacterium]MCD8519949.1 hypothetical protein [Alphaproteobacteria bacterium]MCD8526411.1 hypothetical protein [Alphaproteobacteria bacterium]MCD8571556.1 hypothetical protein [Alphaproteobacteria bacterium]